MEEYRCNKIPYLKNKTCVGRESLKYKKNDSTTINIRNAGILVKLNFRAFSKQSSGLIVNNFEIPHYGYSSRSIPLYLHLHI